jgi:peroxiredoxin Q/BCP
MKRFLLHASLVLLVLAGVACRDIRATPPKPGGLGQGDPAYPFKLMDSAGNWMRLNDVQEGWFLVVILYRGSWCSACLTQLSELKEDYPAFLDQKAAVVGVSVEPVADLAEFQRQWRFPFPLLADPGLRMVDAYGARHPKGHGDQDISRPCVVIIDPSKTVRYKYIGSTPHDHPHSAEILELVRKFKATPLPKR